MSEMSVRHPHFTSRIRAKAFIAPRPLRSPTLALYARWTTLPVCSSAAGLSMVFPVLAIHLGSFGGGDQLADGLVLEQLLLPTQSEERAEGLRVHRDHLRRCSRGHAPIRSET